MSDDLYDLRPTLAASNRDVVLDEERKPILYDAKDRPLRRPVGFRAPEVRTR